LYPAFKKNVKGGKNGKVVVGASFWLRKGRRAGYEYILTIETHIHVLLAFSRVLNR
jgi:hypothetical protein